MFADVILPLNLPQLLTYGVPIELHDLLMPGMRVEVTLGKNKQYSAVVQRLHNEKPDSYQVKPIKSIIDEVPVVTPKQLQFWKWISDYYLAAPGEVMQAALPAHLKLMGETRLQWILPDDEPTTWTEPAYAAVDALISRKEITITELRALVSVRHFAAVLNELLEKEAIRINEGLEQVYKPKKEKLVLLATPHKSNDALSALFGLLTNAPKQLEVLMAYVEINHKKGFVRQAELLDRTNATSTQLKALTEKGIFTIEEKEVSRLATIVNDSPQQVVFTEAQQVAYNELQQALTHKNVVLLHGVTGSGKTLLYVRKIRECIAAGKQALFLLPEIGLTTHLVGRLLAFFGEEIGVYHSHFSNNERVEIWEKVRKGIYKVVVGPRSALWLPYTQLGVIIIDEEHDSSYKQRDPAPRFHARDAAIYLATLFGAQVVLGSATPSIESLYNVQQGKYAFVPLKERYQGLNLPEIQIVPAATATKNGGILTTELTETMIAALHENKQVILFQNRRGYAPFQLCTSCGWVPQCQNCSVSLTYHKSTDKLHCHYCGARHAVKNNCPACGSNNIVSKSFGTEKIEESMKQMFPKAKVARMDVDSMRSKNSIAELLDQVGKNKVDILVGTQMVVKGLDFASVSVVGILSADSLLSFPDFRVNERAFQLMEQVAGRAGRSDGKGIVIVQAYNVKHPILAFVKNHDVASFYRYEIQYRANFQYPPFTRLFKVVFKHKEEMKAMSAAALMAETLQAIPAITVQGPGPAIVARVKDQYLQEIWIKCPRTPQEIQHVKKVLQQQKQHITSLKGHSGLYIVIDVDPY